MSKILSVPIFAVILSAAMPAKRSYADFGCEGGLTAAQVSGFEAFFSPRFSPRLRNLGEGAGSDGYYKVLAREDTNSLLNGTPVIAAEDSLSSVNAAHLKRYLNENAQHEVPSYLSSILSVFVPSAWVGLSADAALHIMNSRGSGGREKLANIAGTVSEGGVVGVIQHVAEGADEAYIYSWSYVYMPQLNGEKKMFLLHSCWADVWWD